MVTATDSTGKWYSRNVQAENTYDAGHLFLTHAKEHVIREPLPVPSFETTFEVTVNGKVHKVPGSKLKEDLRVLQERITEIMKKL
jgi:hypothetical protein